MRESAGRVAPDVRGQRVDLLGGPVAASVLELEDEVVARRAVDGARRRSREPRHTVLAVHDVTANGEIVEESVDVARAGSCGAMHDATTGEVALAPHDDLGVVEREARGQRAFEHADACVEHEWRDRS